MFVMYHCMDYALCLCPCVIICNHIKVLCIALLHLSLIQMLVLIVIGFKYGLEENEDSLMDV